METKDIVILAAVFVFSGYSIYRRYMKKTGGSPGAGPLKNTPKSSLKDQADDYEPYSGKRDKTE
jgi:hypothetical protein